jgi:hypothetical protein
MTLEQVSTVGVRRARCGLLGGMIEGLLETEADLELALLVDSIGPI